MKTLKFITLNEAQLLNNNQLTHLKAGGGGDGGPIRTGGTTHSTTTTSIRLMADGTRVRFYIDEFTGLEVIVEVLPATTGPDSVTP